MYLGLGIFLLVVLIGLIAFGIYYYRNHAGPTHKLSKVSIGANNLWCMAWNPCGDDTNVGDTIEGQRRYCESSPCCVWNSEYNDCELKD